MFKDKKEVNISSRNILALPIHSLYRDDVETFAFMLKTYERDRERAHNLVCSFMKHNIDKIKLFIVVDPEDLIHFQDLESSIVRIISSSDLHVEFLSSNHRLVASFDATPGYINQQIVKLSFWETRLCENYLCLDSDGEFIKDFTLEDFMHDSENPFTVGIEDKDLIADPYWYSVWGKGKEEKIATIKSFLCIEDFKNVKTCHGFQIMSAKYLEKLKETIMKPRQMSYIDLLAIAPMEFAWYNLFLHKLRSDIHYVEPFFKYYHYSTQYLIDRMLGVRNQDIARSYLGIVVNGNFQPQNRQIDARSSLSKILGLYVPAKITIKSLFFKIPISVNIMKHYLKLMIGRFKSPMRNLLKILYLDADTRREMRGKSSGE